MLEYLLFIGIMLLSVIFSKIKENSMNKSISTLTAHNNLMGLHAYTHTDKGTHVPLYIDPPMLEVVLAEIDSSDHNLNMSYLIV